MSNFKNGSLIIRELPKSTQSFEKMLDEIVDEATKIDTYSLNSDLFDLNPECIDKSIIGKNNQIGQNTSGGNFVSKLLSRSAGMIDSQLSTENDIDKRRYETNSGSEKSDRYSSTQDSLCTECRYGSTPNNNFFAFDNNLPQTPGMNLNFDIRDTSDNQNEDSFLQKRSLSVTTEKINPEIPTGQENSLKRFESESSISTVKIVEGRNCDSINREMSLQNITDISQTTEPFATNWRGTSLPDDIRDDDVSEHPVGSERKFSELSDNGKSLSGLPTAHQGHCEKIMHTEGIGNSLAGSTPHVVQEILSDESLAIADIDKNPASQSQSQDLDKTDSDFENTTFSQSTIEEIYYIDDDHNAEISQYRVVAENSMKQKSAISDQIIQEKEIDVSLQLLMHSMPDQINKADNNKPVDLGRSKNLESAKAEDVLQSQIPIEMGLKRIETGNRMTGRNIVSVYQIEGEMMDVTSANDPEFRNKVLDESILEITIDSEMEPSDRQDSIVKRRKIHSVEIADNSKPYFSISKNISKDEKEKKIKTVDLSILNTNNSTVKDSTPLNDVSAKNVEKTISPDYFATQFLTETQLENISEQLNTIETQTVDPPENITLIKDANTVRKEDENIRDDSSLECLSDSQLQRIEEEAYMKVKKPRESLNSNIPKSMSIINEHDVFYRPERPNTIINDLVLPNWVVNPAPEPNYEKMKRAVQMRREYIRKMLQEIQRLSSIVSEVKSVLYAVHEPSSSEGAPEKDSEAQSCPRIQHVENDTNNRSIKSGTFGGSECNLDHCSRIVTKDLENEDIFYVPVSSRSKNKAPPEVVLVSGDNAEGNTNSLKKDLRESGKFYAPQLNASKYNASSIFNRPNIEFSRNKGSSSNTQSTVSGIFGSLKRNFDGTRPCESDVPSIGYKGRDSGIRNRKTDGQAILRIGKFENRINAEMQNEYKLPKIKSSTTICGKENTKSNANKVDPVPNETIFYFPDKLSSSSSNYRALPIVENDEDFLTVNYPKRKSSLVKTGEQRLLNSGKMFASNAIGNDEGIFYKGNK